MFEQERVIGRLQRYVLAAPTIKACFLSGSFGRRAADEYSDIDVVFVFTNEAIRAAAWGKRADLAQAIMPYVPLKAYVAEERRPYMQIVLFANGSVLEIRYETHESLEPNPWDSPIRILKDDDGWLPSFEAHSAGLGKPRPNLSSSDLQQIDDQFWVKFWAVLRLVARGDVDKPFPAYLDLLQHTLPPLLAALPPGDPAREALGQCAYSRDPQTTTMHLANLLEAYLAARAKLVAQYHLQPVATEAFEREIQRLLARML